MNPALRFFREFFGRPGALYALLGAFASVILIIAIGALSSTIIRGRVQRDVDLRAELIYRAIRHQAAASGVNENGDLSRVMDQIADDERILGLGYCTSDGQLAIATLDLPVQLDCRAFAGQRRAAVNLTMPKGDRIRVNHFPLKVGAAQGRLLVAQDLDVSERRERAAQLYVTAALGAMAMGLVVTGAALAFGLRRSWMQSLRGALEESLHPPRAQANGRSGAEGRINALLADLRVRRKFAHGIHVKWSPESLRQLLHDELPDAQVMIVSNREPYIHNRVDGEISAADSGQRPGSALEPVMRACRGVWIAHGGGSADRETVDDNDRADGAAERSDLHAAPRLAHRGGAGRLLLRLRQRGPVAALPYRLRPADLSRAGLGQYGRSTSASPRSSCRRRPAKTRSCWSRTIISRCCRA